MRRLTLRQLSALLALITAVLTGTIPAGTPKCATEDSANCVWDASVRGNGLGRPFVDIGGHTYRLPRSAARVHVITVPDCEDTDGPVVPCVTYDEGQWRVVSSYAPYAYRPATLCATPRTVPAKGTACVREVHPTSVLHRWAVRTR
jgi:hypothetical protein